MRSVDLIVDGTHQICSDWGLGGCRIADYTGNLWPGDKTVVEMFLRVPLPHTGLRVEAEVLRREPGADGGLAMRFDNLTADVFSAFCRRAEEELRLKSEHDA